MAHNKSSEKKAAQIEKAERFYFGTGRIAKLLGFTAFSGQAEDVSASFIQDTITEEFGATISNEVVALRRADLVAAVTNFLLGSVDVEKYEARLRRRFNEEQQFTPLSEIFSYDIKDANILLHVAPARTFTEAERTQQLTAAFSVLATQLQAESTLPQIRTIKMISPLVRVYSDSIEQLGFVVCPVQDQAILEAFSKTTQAMPWEASMAREEFIQMYAFSDR